jgi:anion-transporting  ArsA/GET3 family ATPase
LKTQVEAIVNDHIGIR